jgi:hypothetical protein
MLMRKNKWYIISFLLLTAFASPAQETAKQAVKKNRFFKDESPIMMDLSTDLKKLVSQKKLDSYQPATITLRFPDSSVISEEIRLTARGEFRRQNCFLPTMKLDFRNPGSPQLAPLKKLKLVCGCGTGTENERLVLKEFLVYKMYNLLTDLSFRVRLLRINYQDTRGKIKPYTQYGFFIEDVDEMAKRNKCYEVQKQIFNTEKTDRKHMTLVAIFQYMIGNTDWAIPNYHNMKLMRPVTDSASSPLPVPYDFDFCGVVDASYATPDENLGTKSVTERVYRGFPRSMEELQMTLDIFREKKEAIKELVKNFELLPSRFRDEIIYYLNEFYKSIESKNFVENVFITNARSRN